MTVKTTTRLTTARPASYLDRLALPPAFLVALAVLVIAGSISALGRYTAAHQLAAQPTPPLPVVIVATSQPAPIPTAAPAVQVAAALPRFVVCFDQPVNGRALGPIPDPGAAAIVARYGTGWVMTPWDGGYCWLRAADVGLPDVADLQPPPAAPAPAVVYVAAQQAPAEAVATPVAPEPTSYVNVAQAAAPVQWATAPAAINPADFKEPDKAASCAFTGCLHR